MNVLYDRCSTVDAVNGYRSITDQHGGIGMENELESGTRGQRFTKRFAQKSKWRIVE